MKYLDKYGREILHGSTVRYQFDGFETTAEILFDPWWGVSVNGIRGLFHPEDLEVVDEFEITVKPTD